MSANDLIHLDSILQNSCPALCNVKVSSGQKTMYVYKVNEYRTISGISLEIPAKLKKKAKKYESFEYEFLDRKDWAFITVTPKTFSIMSYEVPPIDIETTFVKYGWDRSVHYGDGGGAFLCYPIYKINSLPISEDTKATLIQKLEEIGQANQDWHKECPVLDIIDPDLSPNYLPPFKVPEDASERSKYVWYPTDVIVNPDLTIKVLGEIHNLPKRGNELLHDCIFKVFESMLVGFEKVLFVSKTEPTLYQVVVKAQKYSIQPGTSYSGKWHVEGKTENIIAAGVYYCKTDEFPQDVVAFHPKQAPDSFYADPYKPIEVEVPVSEGSALVFRNTIPHKFLQLTNETDSPLERLFINFFIVDPRHRLETAGLRSEAFRTLRRVSKIPRFVISEILDYVYSRPFGKKRRELVRESMKTEVSGWGFIHYGNSGDVEFINDEGASALNRFENIISDAVESVHN